MSRISPVEGEDEGFRELFAEMRLFLEVQEVPELLRGVAHSPSMLRGLWSFLRAALESEEGKVRRTTKEYVALAAASAANVGHLKALMLGSLEERGIDPIVLGDLVEKGETLRLPEKTRKILVFARRAALDPALLSDEDFDELRALGLKDSDIAELIGFSGLVAALIAMSRALGLTDPPPAA